jgi:adenine phosphoribosyltransferase
MNIKEKIKTVDNFPKEGVKFLDVTTILEDTEAFKYTVDWLVSVVKMNAIKTIVAIDARGFIWGGAVAAVTQTPLVLARKSSKLPGTVVEMEYDTEYSTSRLALKIGQKIAGPVLVIDDIIATGGTFGAVGEMLHDVWKIQRHEQIHAALVDLSFLGGKEKLLDQGYRVASLATY